VLVATSGPLLHGARLTLRPASPADAGAIAAILAEPEVARWWGPNDPASVVEEMQGCDAFVVVIGDDIAGWVLVDESQDPMYPSVGLDIALGAGYRGRGYGREALAVVIRHYIARGHHRFTIDPAAANERAIRTYAALGFQPVGVLRAYERAPDGGRRDGLLMDLLADELTS
jgi:aminoglycoside 6'-N-acetyltransferase